MTPTFSGHDDISIINPRPPFLLRCPFHSYSDAVPAACGRRCSSAASRCLWRHRVRKRYRSDPEPSAELQPWLTRLPEKPRQATFTSIKRSVIVTTTNYEPTGFDEEFVKVFALKQRFSIPVLAYPRSAYFACFSLLTHLIQIISSLEVSCVHELWHSVTWTIDMLPTQCSLLPSPWAGKIRWCLLHFRTFIHGFTLRSVFTHRQNLLEKREVWHNIPL